jgi:two-component system LytT family sensor kinase
MVKLQQRRSVGLKERQRLSRPLRMAAGFAVILGAWSVVAALLATRQALASAGKPGAIAWLPAFTVLVTRTCVWAALTPPTFSLSRRFPLRSGTRIRSLAVHLLAGAVMATAYSAVDELILSKLPWVAQQATRVAGARPILTYWLVVASWHALDSYGRNRDRALRAAELEVEAAQLRESLARAQLDTLRAQLNPHFLFNTLNTISVLMSEDVAAANRMLLRLGELLRAVLATSGQQVVELRRELDFVRGYLEIEQARFQDRLIVHIHADSEALNAPVPFMLLQPLVENAVRHGIAPRVEAGMVEIRAERRGRLLRLQIRDDGPGRSAAPQPGTGTGLANTRARLDQLYGSSYRFELGDAENGGLVVSVEIPG